MALRRLLSVALAAAALAPTSCAPSGFADPVLVQSVRILASSADKPYARPGESVTLDVLAFDGRPVQPEPMNLYWLPVVCENPTDDAYYACFQQFAKAKNLVSSTGVITAPTGPTYTFTMPTDAVSSHKPTPGAPTPYGLAIVFNVACAGHLELLPIDPGNQNPQALPIGCFDGQHQQLGANDWVFGFTRVYAYDTLRNADPVITSVDVGGKTLAVTAQPGTPQAYSAPACQSPEGCLSMPHCTGDAAQCKVKIGPVVPGSSWEVNPEEKDTNGHPLHEEIWVDFDTTTGSLEDESRLLYDATSGSVSGSSSTTPNPKATDNTFTAPSTPGPGILWMIVHDSRGGAAWVTVPFTVK